MHSQSMGEACTRCFAVTLDFVLRAKGTETIQSRKNSAFLQPVCTQLCIGAVASSLHAPICMFGAVP